MDQIEVDCRGKPAIVELIGEGTDIIIIGAGSALSWARPAAGELAALGFRVINFDYGPPEGWEGEPEPRTALDQVQDVVDVLDAVGVESIHAVGLSRGGITAFGLAARHPDRVGDLVLAFPVAGFEDTLYVEVPPSDPIEGESEVEFLDRMLMGLFSEDFLAERIETARELATTPPGTVTRVERSDEEPFSADDVVTHPTFVIEGGEDLVLTPAHPERYVGAIAGASHLIVDGASHGWLLEQPDRFARLVAGFVKP